MKTKAMTEERIKTKIAEALGWTETICEVERDSSGYRWTESVSVWRDSSGVPRSLPNYPRDLNACAEFEATLTESQKEDYSYELCQLAGDDVFAWEYSARQRCEAFLRTLNLWEE